MKSNEKVIPNVLMLAYVLYQLLYDFFSEGTHKYFPFHDEYQTSVDQCIH